MRFAKDLVLAYRKSLCEILLCRYKSVALLKDPLRGARTSVNIPVNSGFWVFLHSIIE